MKRVVLLVDHFGSEDAGTENQLGKLIRGLSARFDLELITFRDNDWIRTRAQFPCRVSVFQIDKFMRPYTYRNLFRLWRHLRRLRPDIVHTFFPVANSVGVVCARAAGVKRILASRRDYGEWMSARYFYATRVANLFVDGIVVNSHEVKRLTQRVEKFPSERIQVIYNGIAVEAFRRNADGQRLKRTLGIPDTNKVVGLIANYRPMKRHETFVLAAEEILRSRDDVSFIILGKNAVPGDPRKEIERMVAARGLTRRVHFGRAVGNVLEYLAILDVGVNCSEGEGLSNAIMEYMAAKIPCVVSSSGGNPDLITDDEHGYTFPVGDHIALARKVLQILDDAPTRARLIARAYAKVCEEMSLEAMLENFARCYGGAAAAPGQRAEAGARMPTETETRL